MDQVFQLQQQIQRLQQEINDISQVCNQLQQSEQANAIQLQQMTQKEILASQGLRRIQQVANALSQDLNQISNLTSQMVTQVAQVAPLQRNFQQTAGIYPQAYSTVGLTNQIPGTGAFSGQFGTFGQNQQSQIPNINMAPVVSQFPLYRQDATQGYSANLFGTGNQLGTTAQAFSNVGTSQYGMGTQGAFGTNLGATTPFSLQSNLGTQSVYSPYQQNQFGFR
ncbi:MAG: hypothetical protein ACOY46_06245 [Bacillota bacterium]